MAEVCVDSNTHIPCTLYSCELKTQVPSRYMQVLLGNVVYGCALASLQ